MPNMFELTNGSIMLGSTGGDYIYIDGDGIRTWAGTADIDIGDIEPIAYMSYPPTPNQPDICPYCRQPYQPDRRGGCCACGAPQ